MKKLTFLLLFAPLFSFGQNWVTETRGDSVFVEIEKGKDKIYVTTDMVNEVIISNQKKMYETQLALTEAAKKKAQLENTVKSIQATVARHEKLKALLIRHQNKN